jgi:hypothetical protein
MNSTETIKYQGTINSGSCYPKRLEDINQNLPYFEIFKDQYNRYDIKFYNYEKEDNAPRAPYLQGYLKNSILSNVDKSIDIKGFYNIELHDSYTYRNNDINYKNVFTFSKFKDDKGPVLLPDVYQLGNYGNTLQFEDKIQWDKKVNKAVFYGSTTGDRDPLKNKRIDICQWALNKPELYDYKITNIVQMDSATVIQKIPNIEKIMSKAISVSDQINYKYLFNIDGNTSKFDIWPYKTNSIVLKYESKEMLWYHPLMLDKFHFVEVNKNNMESTINHYNNNPIDGQIVSVNARRFLHEILKPIAHQIYTVSLFESIGHNK